MTVKFILDSSQKKEAELLKEINQILKQPPKVDKHTKELATFIDVILRVQCDKRKGPQPKPEEKSIAAPTDERPTIHKPEIKEPEKKEYLIKLFDNPVGILIDKEDDKYLYRIIEPKPDAGVIASVKQSIKKDFERNHSLLEDQRYIQGKTNESCKKLKIQCDSDTARRTGYYLKRDLLGFRRIDPLMHDANVHAIFVDGINKPVKIEYEGLPGKTDTTIMFKDPTDLNVLINRIASFADLQVNQQNPVLETSIHGFKISATLGFGEISSKLTIKKQEQNI